MDELTGPGLGESQRTLLELLKRRGEATLAELEGGLEVARETVRGHLDALVGRRLVERGGVRRGARGRPQVVYRLSPEAEELFPRREGELLAELARFLLAEDGGDLLERFFAARGRERQARLARRLEGLDDGERLAETARSFSQQGFLAETEGAADASATLRLCHCPLRDLVAVTRLPCRSEQALLAHLLGRPVERTQYRPDGDPCCAYAIAPRPATSPDARRPAAS